ncbi:hypothetical protein [Neisseria dumasiana]|uniref:Lipoprotein n=1 Tax=Neisseria dumasiana TaxID=1931275 RepID=A0A1X3DA42_9NEIS|nr:hypothetical protein [Neisseria dumasiana]OSI16676.1 hypothetical protein BV912_11445 [Neisseria dumasiana]OSI16833.1 hypothetical protein BV914_02965 [Neisseria dumasiana]OSI37141.1 hypothetical protein BV913_00485 [Neisseria dumasiana]UOO83683.1 hypothetical protein LVJ88_08235 [Neisseria dumasiana]
MRIFQTAPLLSAALLLAACAITPEQRAARDAAQKKYEQDLQVSLASQCDKETAELMREQFDSPPRSEKEQKAFRLRYIDKVSDPMFQACYKLAWQNYIARQELERARYYHDWDGFYYPFRRYCYYCW